MEQSQQKQWGFQKQTREAWPYAIKFDGGEDCVRCLTRADAERVVAVLNECVVRVSLGRVNEGASGMRDEANRDLVGALDIVNTAEKITRHNGQWELAGRLVEAATVLEQYIKKGGGSAQPKDEVDALITQRNMLLGDLSDILATVKCGRDAARNNEQGGGGG